MHGLIHRTSATKEGHKTLRICGDFIARSTTSRCRFASSVHLCNEAQAARLKQGMGTVIAIVHGV